MGLRRTGFAAKGLTFLAVPVVAVMAVPASPAHLIAHQKDRQHFPGGYLLFLVSSGSPKKTGDLFRVGIFLGFVRLTTRTMHPRVGPRYVRGAKRNRLSCH